MPNNKKEEKSVDNTYGGVRYRFSYDDSRRAALVRQLRLRRRGSRSFWLTVGIVSLFCFCTLTVSLVFKGMGTDTDGESAENDGEMVAVSAQSVTEQSRTYPERFVISELNDRAREVYHLPAGVMISDICEGEDTVMNGDIIVAVNGMQTPSADSFHAIFASAKGTAEFSVYRRDKILNLEYVVEHEE